MCGRGIHPYAPFADALDALKSRGFGAEIGVDIDP